MTVVFASSMHPRDDAAPAGSSAPCEHAVVIATIGRVDLLERALASVAAQSHHPRQVLLSVDGDQALVNEVQSRAKGTEGLVSIKVLVFKNDRVKGASGAWNTALDQLTRQTRDPRDLIVSFLDDDDEWEPTHLADVDAAMANGVEVVATTIVRHDTTSPDGELIEPPTALVHSQFLIGNPGIQGSNLSARLSALLEAGLFDEALPSCTDRDICIRLADLGARYAAVRGGRIHHHATGNDRLSTPGSDAKQRGLATFHAKHAWRMTSAQEQAFLERSHSVFGWTPAPPEETAAPTVAREVRTQDPMTLVVGAIIDGDVPARALPFLDGLAKLNAHPRIEQLAIVLLQNGASKGCTRIVDHGHALGLQVRFVREAECLALDPELGIDAQEIMGRKSIAVARTLLQRFTFEVAREYTRPIVWIADDDVRVPLTVDLFLDDMARARATGMDVAIGMVAGAPPIPAATALRTQLVDLVSFLRGAAVRETGDAAPDAEHHNARWKSERNDYYYDLVRRETDRLETPFLPRTQAATLGRAVAEIAERAPRMLAGEQLFRPVQPATGDPIELAKESCLRGGNTFVFDIELLRDVPNLSPRIGERRLRRSDMLWATLARFQRGKSVKQLPIVVEHDRSHDSPRGLDADKLFDDVLGYAFSRALNEHLDLKSGTGKPRQSPRLDQKVIREGILKRTSKFARERFAEMRLSCWRIRGLARAIDHLLDTAASRCGLDEAGTASLRSLANELRKEFAQDALVELDRRITDGVGEESGFYEYLDVVVSTERIARARRVCEERLGRRTDEVLGHGGEGVVFRVGERIAKVFDRWSTEDRTAHLCHVHTLAQRPAPDALPRVLAVHDASDPVVVEMEWERSDPYVGGRGPEVVALLRSLCAAGWSYTNIHPKNLRVTRRGLRLVDVGRSLTPFSVEAEEHGARRALLAMRCADNPDLAGLMKRSNDDASLPELRGVQHLLAAVRGEDVKASLDRAVTGAVHRSEPASLLDFGCGKPRRWQDLAGDATLSVFDPQLQDPGSSLAQRWRDEAPEVKLLDEAALHDLIESGERFDAVLCSLVLCTLDAREMTSALTRVRRLVRDGGAVVVAVCDPRSALVEHTARHRRFVPQGARHEDSFTYVKHVIGGGPRVEHHRPLSAYRRAFFDAGFRVDAEQTVEGIDTERFEAVSEHVVFELTPHRATAPRRPHSAELRAPLAGLTVLSYHRIADASARDPSIELHRARGMVVSKAAFTAQMRAVGRAFEPVRLEDVHRAATGRGALPHRAVWVTFDDGYRDVLDTVAPVMERERLTATLFVRAPGRDGLPAWAPLDLYYQVLARAGLDGVRAQVPQGEERERLLSASCVDQIREATALATRLGVDLRAVQRDDLYLRESALSELQAQGFSLGAHGTEHVRWTTLEDGPLERVVGASADWLGRRAPGEPLCVAYPDAAIDQRVATAAARGGFTVGVILEAPALEVLDPRLSVRRRIARDDASWIEQLGNEMEAP